MAVWTTPRQEVPGGNRYLHSPWAIRIGSRPANLHRLIRVIVVVVLRVMGSAVFVIVIAVIVTAVRAAIIGLAMVRALVVRTRGVIRLIVVTTTQRECADATREGEQTFHFHGENLTDSPEKASRSKAERCSPIGGNVGKRGGR